MPFIRPVISGGVAAPTVWEYISLAVAEASGDPWVDNDDIYITSKTTYKYRSDLAVTGYSGLIHKEPYGSGNGTLTNVALRGSEAAGGDPDADWVSGWKDTSTGVSTSIDNTGSAPASRFRLTSPSNSSRASMESTHYLRSADTETFLIVDDLVQSANHTATWNGAIAGLQAYKDGVKYVRLSVTAQIDALSQFLGIQHTTYYATTFSTIPKNGTPTRFFLYLNSGRYTAWKEDDLLPIANGTAAYEQAYTGADTISYYAGGAAGGGTGQGETRLGNQVFGAITVDDTPIIPPTFDPQMMTYAGAGKYEETHTAAGDKITVVARFNTGSITGTDVHGEAILASRNFASGDYKIWVGVMPDDSVNVDERGKIRIWVNNSAGTQIANLFSTSTFTDSSDHVLFIGLDMSIPAVTFYVDGSDEEDAGHGSRVFTSGTLPSGSTIFLVGGRRPDSYASAWNGDIGYCGMRDNVYLTNQSDFMDGSGPLELDVATWTEWGAQPNYWAANGRMTINLGSEGNMTVVGTITGPA